MFTPSIILHWLLGPQWRLEKTWQPPAKCSPCATETCLNKKNSDYYQIFKNCFVTPYDYNILQHSPFTKPLAVSSYLKWIIYIIIYIYKPPGPKHPVTSKIATGKALKNNHLDGLEPQHWGTWSLPNYKLQDRKTNSSNADGFSNWTNKRSIELGLWRVALFSQLLSEYFGFAELQKMRKIWFIDSPSSGFQQI